MKYVVFRILETVFLFGVVFTWNVAAESYFPELSYRHIGLSYSISDASETFIINSLLVGFALSLYTTVALHKGSKGLVWVLSLLIALTGFAGYANEIIRLFAGHTMQIVIDLSLALLLLDWALVFVHMKGAAKTVITPEQRVAAMLGKNADG